MLETGWERKSAIGLGSNTGDRERALCEAGRRLLKAPGCKRVAVSSLYQSPAWKCEPGAGDFLNAVLIIETQYAPLALMRVLTQLELTAGPRHERPRDAEHPYRSRALDLDLLLMGTQIIRHDDLMLPHPGIRERDFVLRPLAEIAPEWPLPPDGLSAGEALDQLAGESTPCVKLRGPEWLR